MDAFTFDARFILLLIFFILIFCLSFIKTRTLGGKKVNLFRAFFPSWKFFEDVGPVPRLFYKVTMQGQASTDWLPCWHQQQRKISHLFLNAETNYLLTCGSLLNQLVTELEEIDDAQLDSFTQSVSYQLTQRLVQEHIEQQHHNYKVTQYQFKVSAQLPLNLEFQDIFISPEYEAPHA